MPDAVTVDAVRTPLGRRDARRRGRILDPWACTLDDALATDGTDAR